MKKRILSLLCVLALCLGLLPVTALAEGVTTPQTLYVSSTPITSGYWKTNTEGKLESGSESDYNVYYDGSGTLTLHNATITGNNSSSESLGAGIYAVSSADNDVALTINLEGTSIVSGDYGIYVQANQNSTPGGNSALLTISGDGTLAAIGNSSYGIAVFGYNGGAALTIENATVNASTSANYAAAGVIVRSGSIASDSPEISLTVKGGSLTASGGSGDSEGIWFYVGHPNATATTSLTVGENAIVDAKAGGIRASNPNGDISDPIVVDSDTGTNGGIVWNGKEGTVYGDVTLDESLTINKGETLTVPEGAKLDCNGNLTNSGTILVSGGTLSGGTALTTPKIITHPQDKEVQAGSTAEFSVTASVGESGDTASLTYQWQQKTSDSSDWTNISDNATDASYTTVATTTGMNNYQYRCVVTAGGVGVISSAATLTVEKQTGTPPSITTTSLPDGRVGRKYEQILEATGDAPITWSVTDGKLPDGLTLNGSTGEISGTPIKAGEFTFTVQAVNGSGIDTSELSREIEKDNERQSGSSYSLSEGITRDEPGEGDSPEDTEKTDDTENPVNPAIPSYSDVGIFDWYYEGVTYSSENGIMSGMGDGTFAPNTALSREMMATILWNMAGKPEAKDVAPFLDVTSDKYYAEAIAWANENGIVAGFGDTFGVGQTITREQFAVMLYNYAVYEGYDTTQGGMAIREFTDFEKISDYAVTAMTWAVNNGIIDGYEDGSLRPQGGATRAEAASMLMNFCKNADK